MPSQRICCGRLVTFQLPPRRFQFAFALLVFLVFMLASLGNRVAEYPAVSAVTEHIPSPLKNPHIPGLPSKLHLFAPAAHKPPVQSNSSVGEARWFSDWRWKNPFSGTVTLDEERAVLPPLRTRPAVYTYYEASPQAKKDRKVRTAEERLLLQWRRAWWAQGFRPTVLGRPEALNNPLYKKVQMMGLQDSIDIELMRWLAWGDMGDGVLSNWLAFPMDCHDDGLFKFLRRGYYQKMTKYEKLGSGLYCGSKKLINNAIEAAISAPEDLKKVSDLSDKSFDDLFKIDKTNAIAFYDFDTIKNDYKSIGDAIFTESDLAKGYGLLSEVINAHLQTTWQNNFNKGVGVIKPMAQFMTALTDQALEIAGNLTSCAQSPLPASCPPNNKFCKRCLSSQPKDITTPPAYRNISGLFQIASVPHPFTTTAMNNERDVLDVKFVRSLGFKARDAWIKEITKDWLGTGISAMLRSSRIKEVVAGEHGSWNTLFLTAEREYHEDLDWIFGFAIPSNVTSSGKSETPVPGPERRPKPKQQGPVVSQEQLSLERKRLTKVREGLASKSRHFVLIRDAVESWNLADTEIWRFARAWSARTRMERLNWEEDENSYAGSEKKRSRKGSWGRWFDEK